MYDGNRNRNNKEMSENVFSRVSNLGLLVTGQIWGEIYCESLINLSGVTQS